MRLAGSRRRPGQRQAVVGGGAAADFIHQHRAVLGGVVQDVGGFGHLHHEGRTAGSQIVRRADAGEDAIHRADGGLGGRHVTADVRHQHNQRRLPHIGAFTAHVRAGDDQHAALWRQGERVGDKRLAQHLLYHRVAAFGNADPRLFTHGWASVVQGIGALGQIGQHVQLGQCGGALLQFRRCGSSRSNSSSYRLFSIASALPLEVSTLSSYSFNSGMM